MAGCPELAKTEYQHRHDKAASYLHWNICKELNINVEEKWYEHERQTVTEKDNITILWDMPIQTDREIKANRPDIVIKDKQETAAYSLICPSLLKRTFQLKLLKSCQNTKTSKSSLSECGG